MAAGLIAAVPAHAAVAAPAGCTIFNTPTSKEDVFFMECKTLGNGADFTSYPRLSSLAIGDTQTSRPSSASLTKMPKLPASLDQLLVNAPKMTDYSNLAGAKNLSQLHVEYPTKQLSLSSIARWNPGLTELSVSELNVFIDASPIARLKKLEAFHLSGDLPGIRANEGSWTSVAYPKGLDGKPILPKANQFVDEPGKKGPVYNYDAKTGKTRFNSAMNGTHSSKSVSSKPTAAQPKLRQATFDFYRNAEVAMLSEWAQDKKMKLVLRGTAQMGKTVTAQLSDTSNPFKAYVDSWQWYRNGVAIKGATKASYKLAGADLGKKITVKATDNKEGFGFGIFRYIPYSVILTATNKTQYGFTVHKPSIAGTALPGKTLTAKFKKWGGSPTRYSYQWYRNGKPIKAATRSTYKAANADKGQKLTVKVTGSKKNYQTVSSTSVATSVAKMLNIQKPSIRYGQVFEEDNKNVVFSMIASNGKWNFPATKYSYQWYRNGRSIKGATVYGLVVRTGTFDDKTKFTVKVTAKSKYGSASATSNGFNRWG